MRKHFVDQGEGTDQIEFENAGPFGGFDAPAGDRFPAADIGDKTIDAAPMSADLLDGGPDHGRVGQVARDAKNGVGAEFVLKFAHGGIESLLFAAGDHDPRAFGEKAARDGPADSTRGTGDKGDLVLQAEIHDFDVSRNNP